jgi:hypothetical protein
MMGMPTCREVAHAVAGDELEEGSARRRLGVRLHLMMCRHCRRYARQIRAIGRAARDVLAPPAGERERLLRLERALLALVEPPADDD